MRHHQVQREDVFLTDGIPHAVWHGMALWAWRSIAQAAGWQPSQRRTQICGRWRRERRISLPKPNAFIHLFNERRPVACDTFDPKPSLAKYAGKLLPAENLKTERKTGRRSVAIPIPPVWPERYEVSDLFPHVASISTTCRDPIDARGCSQPRAFFAVDELR